MKIEYIDTYSVTNTIYCSDEEFYTELSRIITLRDFKRFKHIFKDNSNKELNITSICRRLNT